MSFRDCVGRGAAGGEMSKEKAERVLREYDDIFEELKKNMGHTQAEAEAARRIVKKVKGEAKERRRVAQLQIAANKRQLNQQAAHRNIKGENDPASYVVDLVSNKRGLGQGNTLAGKYDAVRRSLRSEMTAAIQAFKANVFGMRRNKETLRNVVREIFGESTGDKHAAAIAKAWGHVSERARTRFNAAGGHIAKRADWGLPQSHNTRAVRKAGFEAWRDFILPRLDLDKMARDWNDGVPFSPQKLELILRDSFEAIRTDGYSRRGPAARHGSAVYNRRGDHRFFSFKSADDWMTYSERFGSQSDAFRVMITHLDDMAMDIALMEELGPSPMNAFQMLQDAGMKRAAISQGPGALDRAKRKAKLATDMLDVMTGRTNISDHSMLARGGSALRQYLTSTHLGSAVLSSLTDFNTQRINAGFIGLAKTGSMRKLFRLAASRQLREEANTAGLIFENAVDIANAAARYNFEDIHIESAARLADFTIRASGLGWLTELQRQAFGLEFLSTAAKWKGKAFADLEPQTQRMFQGFGIGPTEWEAIRKAKTHTTPNGLELLRAQEIEEVAGAKLADRYMEAVSSLTDFSVPTTDILSKAAVLGSTRSGTIAGQFVRFGLQFKSFPVTLLVTQFGRVMREVYQGRKGSAVRYAAGLFIGNTILGALALQLKEMAKGRDPRDATTPKFWAAAAAQGGGAGIFGDFFFSDVSRFGGSLGATAAGPGVGFMNDALRFTVGNVQELAAGEDTRAGKEAVDLLRRYTPGGSLWYGRLVYEREILDGIQSLVDPKAQQTFRRKISSARDYDTGYFFPPGASIIRGRGNVRPPDLANVAGGAR